MRINQLKNCCQKLTLRAVMLSLLALAVPGSGLAVPNPLDELQAVQDWELASMRGGYVSSAGLEITFGIETAIFIDGIMQAVTSFNSIFPATNLPDSRVIGQTAGPLSTSRGTLVQTGFTPMDVDAVGSHLFTIVQNSQDHRVIDTITQLNATVTSLGAYRQGNFSYSLQQQLIDSRR